MMKSSQLNEKEYHAYYQFYIDALGNINLIDALTSSLDDFLAAVKNLPEEKLKYRYAEGKWTIKDLIQHLIDTERIMSYRALRFSRNDRIELQGFDENLYVENSNGNDRNIHDLLEELAHIRKTSVLLFQSFTDEMLTSIGIADGNKMSVRALGFITAGHLLHHLKVIKEKYL